MSAHLVAEGLDTTELMELVLKNRELFDQYPFRTQYAVDSPHREVHDIILRCPELSVEIQNDKLCVNYPAMDVFGKALFPHLSALMASVGGVGVGRVILTMLEQGKQVYPHEDQGAACDFYHRFHLVLFSDGGVLTVDGVDYPQKTGEVWWFANNKEHSVVNNGPIPRVVIIIDLELIDGGTESGT